MNDTAPEVIDPCMAAGHDVICNANYVARKEDLEYEELSTLEGLLSLFEHDKALDIEIANLKEDCLFNTINELEDELKAAKNSETAMMLLSYINPADIPDKDWNHIMKEAAMNPSILLQYVPEDAELSWPVYNTMHGMGCVNQYVSHGFKNDIPIEDALKTIKDAADKEDA